jgi:hypothetical protein
MPEVVCQDCGWVGDEAQLVDNCCPVCFSDYVYPYGEEEAGKDFYDAIHEVPTVNV